MSLTPSQMLDLGSEAPGFRLPDADGAMHALADAASSKAIVVMFICNHCPFVKHLADELARLGRDYQDRGVSIFAINSNDTNTHPTDDAAHMRQEIEGRGYAFPYLIDADQSVAKAYRAACTPDFYLFDENRKLVYRGQFDSSRPGNGVVVDGSDLRAAIDAVLAGDAVAAEQLPSVGCNIKWKPGNAPAYFG